MENKLSYSDHIKHYITDAEVSDYFNPNKTEVQSIRRRYQYFKALLSFKKNDRFCEIGSGGGEALNILKNAGVTYNPVDLSLKNLKIILQKSAIPTFPVTADVYNLPYKDAVFDKLVMSEVMEHLQYPEQALREIYRILKPGGIAVISVPYEEKLTYQLCIHCNKLTPTFAHLHSFDEKKIADYFVDAGFVSDKILKVGNKVLKLIGLNFIFVKMPFRLWKISDYLFNFIIPKPSYLVIVAKK